jgi:hypothetical protein
LILAAGYDGSKIDLASTQRGDSAVTPVETFMVSLTDALNPPPMTKWEREYRAFKRLLPELLKTHRGKYVAVHDEHVVDTDTDEIALIRRVHAKVGYVPIHVEIVTDPPPPPIRIPHYRVYRPKGSE